MDTKKIVAAVAVGLSLFGVAQADSWDNLSRRNVTVENASGTTIESLYMSAVSDDSWESDLLGSGYLSSGSQTRILADPGRYDVKLVDRDGDECIVNNVQIQGDRVMTITANMLMRCEGYR
jgi:hypothetical protein